MKKILVFGASGMAGHVIYNVLKNNPDIEVLGTFSSTPLPGSCVRINIHNTESVLELISSFSPDVVINCIGVLVKGSKLYPDVAIYANAYWPHYLSQLGAKHKFKLIHISTDCVFSGNHNGGYTEQSAKDAKDLYGMSKALGEINDNKNLTVRTSIIGPEIKLNGEGLFDWFMKQNGTVNGYRSSIWSGVTTFELSRFLNWVMEVDLTGIFHLTNNNPISKYDLLSLIRTSHNKKIEIVAEKDYTSNKSFINTNKKVGFHVNSYQEMLEQQYQFMRNNQSLYNQYNLW